MNPLGRDNWHHSIRNHIKTVISSHRDHLAWFCLSESMWIVILMGSSWEDPFNLEAREKHMNNDSYFLRVTQDFSNKVSGNRSN